MYKSKREWVLQKVFKKRERERENRKKVHEIFLMNEFSWFVSNQLKNVSCIRRNKQANEIGANDKKEEKKEKVLSTWNFVSNIQKLTFLSQVFLFDSGYRKSEKVLWSFLWHFHVPH